MLELARPDWTAVFQDLQRNETLAAFGETIISATDTAGTKAALVNRLFDLAWAVLPPERHRELLDLLTWFDTGAMARYDATFVNLSDEEK